MATLTDQTKTIAFFSLPSDLTANKLDTNIDRASIDVIALIGQSTYTTLSALPDADADRERADRAESALALYYAMPFLNLRWTEIGGLVRAVGFDQGRTELMSKRELDAYRGELYKEAMTLLSEWITEETDADDDPIEVHAGGIHFMSIELG